MSGAVPEDFIFILAMERAIPSAAFGATTDERIAMIERALAATGTHVGSVRTTIEVFAEAFEQIGAAFGVDDYFAQGAIAASPHDLLDDDDPTWRMGYFDAETVEMVHDEAAEHQPALAALDSRPVPVQQLRDLLLAACDEGAASGQSLIILHTVAGLT